MKIHSPSRSRRAFTLIELMTASTIALIITGAIIMMLFYTAREQLHGLADNTVEEESYILENQITTTLRSMSAGAGMQPVMNTGVQDAHGNFLGYQAVYTFTANSSGGYTTSEIYFDTSSSNVVFIPDITNTNNYSYWITNNPSYAVQNLSFNTSLNPDGSQNSALVNVVLQMNDNTYSRQNATNNPASVYRSFSVLMLSN